MCKCLKQCLALNKDHINVCYSIYNGEPVKTMKLACEMVYLSLSCSGCIKELEKEFVVVLCCKV